MAATTPRQLHVLLVDDDASLRHALARAIRLAGFDAESFASVDALLARGVCEGDACLVLDIDAMGVDRLECRRALEKICRDLPTILITALAAADGDSRLPEFAGAALLYKPFDKDELIDAIRRCAA